MKETTRFSPPSLRDCIEPSRNQYMLLQPYIYTYIVTDFADTQYTCNAGYPDEWNRPNGICPKDIGTRTPRFTCLTNHTVAPTPSLGLSLTNYTSRPCVVGTLKVDGVTKKSATNSCIVYDMDGNSIDNTIYEDVAFHTIPSILRHISPTDEELAAADNSSLVPSLPVDMVRYMEFLTPNGNIARINYPNFFDLPATSRDIVSVRTWIKNQADTEWSRIINTENTTPVSSTEASIKALLSPGVIFPTSPIDWNVYISDAAIEQIIRARNWQNPDVTTKYKQSIETMLSYSHEYSGVDKIKSPPIIPMVSPAYEIAYLALAPFLPQDRATLDPDESQAIDDYNIRLAEIQ
jgi:hypothetical protein